MIVLKQLQLNNKESPHPSESLQSVPYLEGDSKENPRRSTVTEPFTGTRGCG